MAILIEILYRYEFKIQNKKRKKAFQIAKIELKRKKKYEHYLSNIFTNTHLEQSKHEHSGILNDSYCRQPHVCFGFERQIDCKNTFFSKVTPKSLKFYVLVLCF